MKLIAVFLCCSFQLLAKHPRHPFVVRGDGQYFQALEISGETQIKFQLILAKRDTLYVEGVPKFDEHYDSINLFCSPRVQGLPKGVKIRLRISGKGMPEFFGGGANGRLNSIPEGMKLIEDQEIRMDRPPKKSGKKRQTHEETWV